MNSSSASKVIMKPCDALFNSSESYVNEAENIINVPLSELFTFKNHPFKVLDDEKMAETVESIQQHGILTPAIARPRISGGYELISGHRRKHAAELAGLSEMPVIVRNYTNDEATIIMVDSNIQRENILPSEKAKAYKLKFEAMKHRGSKTGNYTYDEIGETAGDNGKTVQRYIRLTELIPELLTLVDEKKIGFIASVDISSLSIEEQKFLYRKISDLNIYPNGSQAASLKKYSLSRELNDAVIDLILSADKTKSKKFSLKAERLKEYFSEDYSDTEIENIIYELLENWKSERSQHQ